MEVGEHPFAERLRIGYRQLGEGVECSHGRRSVDARDVVERGYGEVAAGLVLAADRSEIRFVGFEGAVFPARQLQGVGIALLDADQFEVSKVVGEEDGGDISYDSSTRKNTFLVDPKKVHEIHIGTFEFPTCSYNLQEPQVKALVEINVRSSDVTKKIYTRSLRIDQLKLVPHVDSE